MSKWTADDLFRWWIVQQQNAVMVHLGKITHPVTGQVERDLETARLLIDLLSAMETKTKGNLSGEEERFLGSVLTNLRLNFVQEANRPDPPAAGSDGQAGEQAPRTAGERPPAEDGGAVPGGSSDAAEDAPGDAEPRP